MKRNDFLRLLALAPMAVKTMKMNALRPFAASREATAPMPVLFLGHGSPMNAIEENVFTANFQKLGHELATPKAILCISAHWETRGTMVTAMRQPPTIHDFRGFPRELSEVQYPAPGSPDGPRRRWPCSPPG